MTDNVKIDGIRISDTVSNVCVDGQPAEVCVDGVKAYDVPAATGGGDIAAAPLFLFPTLQVSNSIDVNLFIDDDGTYTFTGWNAVTHNGNWSTTPAPGIGAGWFVRAINLSAQNPSVDWHQTLGDSAQSWLDLSASRRFVIAGDVGGNIPTDAFGSTVDLEFSKDGGATVHATWTVSFGEKNA